MRLQHLASQLTETRQPFASIQRKLLVNFAAQTLRYSGTFAGCGDGNLQRTAADDRAEKEIAVGNIVNTVAGNVSHHRFAINRVVDFRRVGSGDDEKASFQIFRLERALDKFEFALGSKLMHFR